MSDFVLMVLVRSYRSAVMGGTVRRRTVCTFLTLRTWRLCLALVLFQSLQSWKDITTHKHTKITIHHNWNLLTYQVTHSQIQNLRPPGTKTQVYWIDKWYLYDARKGLTVDLSLQNHSVWLRKVTDTWQSWAAFSSAGTSQNLKNTK